MKSFSAISAFLLVCFLAFLQVWAAPAEETEATENTQVANFLPTAEQQAYMDWYNAASQQYARPLVARDGNPQQFPPFFPPTPFPPFPPFPPPPTFPPFPPFPPGRGW